MFNLQKTPIYFLLISSILAWMPAAVATAQSEAWDTEYISDDTFFVFALNVEKLVDSMKDSEVFDELKRAIHSEMRLDVSDISQFQFVMGGEEQDMQAEDFDDEDILEIKLLFKEDQNVQEFVERMFRHAEFEKAKHEGVEYFRSSRRSRPSVHAPDKKTIVVANEPRLKRLMESPKTMGNFVDQLARADAEADLFLAFKNNKVLDELFLSEVQRELDGLPFNLRDIASEAKQGELTINLDSQQPIVGQIINKNPEGAQRVKRAIDALIALGKIGLPEAKKEVQREGLPEELRKLALEGIAIGQSLLDGAKITADQAKLNIEFTTEKDLKDAVKIVVMTLFNVRVSVGAVGPDAVEEKNAAEAIEK